MNTRRITALLITLICGAALIALGACGAPTPVPALQNPTVELDHVEVASYFPWPTTVPTAGPQTPTPAPIPASRIPMVLAFVFDVTNPNPYPVTLKDLQHTVEFEAAPNEFFPVGNPFAHEDMSIPANTTNELRVVLVLDSLVTPGNLAVTSGSRMKELGLTPGGVVSNWWSTIGDFPFKIRVTGGSAEFSSPGGNAVVPFEGEYPK